MPFGFVRKMIREQRGIRGDYCDDFMCAFLCGCCTMIQAKR
jgi:Cys-rich protein (TIGR01571 family)